MKLKFWWKKTIEVIFISELLETWMQKKQNLYNLKRIISNDKT